MNSFVAIDFETANHQKDSACAVGLATGRNRSIEAVRSFLIRPPEPLFVFTGVHGLRWEDVRNAPTFGELWPTLLACIGDAEFMAAYHNASFDRQRASSMLRHVRDLGAAIAVHLHGRAGALAVGHLPDTVARCLPASRYPTVPP